MNRSGGLVVSVATLALAVACGSASGGVVPSAATTPSATAVAGAAPTIVAGKGLSHGHVVVADNGGTLWDINPSTGAKRVLSSNSKSVAAGGKALFEDIFGVAREADGNLVVIARRGSTATTHSGPHSRLIRVNARTGAQTLIASNSKMHYSLTSIAVAKNGEIYFGDENVPDPPYNDAVVYGANPKTGKLRIVTSDTKSVKAGGIHRDEDPLGLAVAPNGTLFVLADVGGDDSAPPSPNDFVGAVVAVNPATGKQTLVTSNYYSKRHGGQSLFADPRAMVRAPNGNLYIVDDAAINNSAYGAKDTKVILVNPKTGAQKLISNNAKSVAAGGKALFDRPYGIAVEPDGQLLVDDGHRLLRVNPNTGAQSIVASGMGTAIGIVSIP